MESGVLSMTLLMAAAIVVPFTAIKLGIKKNEKKGYKKLKEIALKNKDEISDYDIQGNFAIGWDSKSKHLYYYKNTDIAEFFEDIDLKNMNDCTITKQSKRSKSSKNTSEVLDKMALSFKPNTHSAAKQIELYDADESYHLTGELEIAEKWQQIICKAIKDK
jgi:hypothetical protein